MFKNIFKRKRITKSEEPKELIQVLTTEGIDESNLKILQFNDDYIPEHLKGVKLLIAEVLVAEGQLVQKSQLIYKIHNDVDPKLNLSFHSPARGRILRLLGVNHEVKHGLNCSILKSLDETEFRDAVFNFLYKETSRSKINSDTTQIKFKEDNNLTNPASAYLNIIEDEFNGKRSLMTSSYTTSSENRQTYMTLSFGLKDQIPYLSFITLRKQFKWPLGSKIYFLFEDETKIELKVNKKGNRLDKTESGVRFQCDIDISNSELSTFSTTPFKKWKLEDLENGIEIKGGLTSRFIASDKLKAKKNILLMARILKDSIN